MKLAAAIFIVLIISVGLLNSYRKYKNELLPLNFLFVHLFIGILMMLLSFYLLFE